MINLPNGSVFVILRNLLWGYRCVYKFSLRVMQTREVFFSRGGGGVNFHNVTELTREYTLCLNKSTTNTGVARIDWWANDKPFSA